MRETVPDVAVLAWSADLKVVHAAGDCAGVLGAQPADLLGAPMHEALGIAAAQGQDLDARAHRGETTTFVRRRRGEEAGWLRVSCDVTGERVRASVIDLDKVLAGAPPVQISPLASSLSHEMRNPLSSVKMAVQTLARNTSLSDRDQRRLVIANREVRTLERLLWLLSEYGKDAPPALDTVPLRSLVQEAAALIELELTERRTQLHVETASPAAVARIRADTARLRPVLAQLFLNVASGQPEGSALNVHLEPRGEGCQVRIDDPSATLPQEERARAFEPFANLLSRGAGLSLATLARVMAAHGGSVSADASASGGTVYTLSFPA